MLKNCWRATALIATLLPAAAIAAKSAPNEKITYQYSRHGGDDVSPTVTPTVVLSGGASDVDDAFKAMCKANNGGDILVLGTATFNKNYFSYIRGLCLDAGVPANSVSILIVPDREAANQQFVSDTIMQAETVWIAGGDQSKYIELWMGAGVQTALNQRIQNGVVIGGISAGLTVLTDFVFSAQTSTSVTSSYALTNPNSDAITLIRGFVDIPALRGIIGDAHFVTRDRMGRDLVFLYRIFNGPTPTLANGISVDEATAVVIVQNSTDRHWKATILGSGNAYFLQPKQLPRTRNVTGSLTGVTVDVDRIAPAGAFDITTWSGSQGAVSYTVFATNGVLTSTQLNNALY